MASVLCPIILMAADRGTPALSRFLTAVRLRSWGSLPGSPTGGFPRPPEISNRLTLPMKYPRDDLAPCPLHSLCVSFLALKHAPQLGNEGKLPSLTVLRLSWFQAEPPAKEVHMHPLPREQLRSNAPACEVGSRDNGLQWLREMADEDAELLRLEKAGADIVLSEHCDMWTMGYLPCLLAETKHAAERRQLPVDRAVGSARLLTGTDVRHDAIRGQTKRGEPGERAP